MKDNSYINKWVGCSSCRNREIGFDSRNARRLEAVGHVRRRKYLNVIWRTSSFACYYYEQKHCFEQCFEFFVIIYLDRIIILTVIG